MANNSRVTRSQNKDETTQKEMSDFIFKCKENFENFEKKLDNIDEKNKKIQIDINAMRDEIIKNLVESNKKLQNKVEFLEKKIEKLEKNDQKNSTNIEVNNQYGRRNNLEISGIPNSVEDDNLEEKVIKILGQIGVKVRNSEIEACHRLPPTKKNPTKKTIIRFVNRKKVEKTIKNKKNLGQVDLNELDLPEGTKLFAGENLNEFYRELGWHCRRLKRENLIYHYKYQNEAFFIKIKENSEKYKKIFHQDDLIELFPDFFAENLKE